MESMESPPSGQSSLASISWKKKFFLSEFLYLVFTPALLSARVALYLLLFVPVLLFPRVAFMVEGRPDLREVSVDTPLHSIIQVDSKLKVLGSGL